MCLKKIKVAFNAECPNVRSILQGMTTIEMVEMTKPLIKKTGVGDYYKRTLLPYYNSAVSDQARKQLELWKGTRRQMRMAR